MRKVFSLSIWVVLIAAVAAGGCKKEDSKSKEEDLRVSIDAGILNITPGPDFEFNVTIESAVPGRGVNIGSIVRGESDNQDYPQGSPIGTTAKTTKIKVTNLPRQKICVCTVTVVSIGDRNNSAIVSFRVAYK